MEKPPHKTYFVAMAVYWMGFGLITTFYPALMDLFQTPEGVAAKTAFSDHVWMHGGFDILSFCVLLFALSTQPASRTMLRAAAIAALGPTIAIFYSIAGTSYWSPLFIGSGLGCLAFAVWGWILSGKVETDQSA